MGSISRHEQLANKSHHLNKSSDSHNHFSMSCVLAFLCCYAFSHSLLELACLCSGFVSKESEKDKYSTVAILLGLSICRIYHCD